MNIESIKFEHVCEVCGKTENLLPSEAYSSGWDYPPNMGAWGVISGRTCGDCGIESTLWWALIVDKKTVEQLNESHLATLNRIMNEPGFVKTIVGSKGA